jgi:threonine/homoserine/homoserine lactone efflux protein
MVTEFGAFLGVSALVIVTPGQDTALVIRNSLAGGRRGGISTAAGVVLGQATWVLASGVGLTALLLASQPAFAAVRLAGAAYLVWLGGRSLYRAVSRSGGTRAPAARLAERTLTPRAALAQGLMSAIGNAKLAVFFVSLLPQFLPHGRVALPTLLALGLTFCGMTLAWLTGYAIVVAKAGDVLSRPRPRRIADALLGATLVAFGVRLARAHR